jgi:hypothetical protein
MIQYRNFSNATYGVFEVIETGDRETLQQRFNEIHVENQGATVRGKWSSKGQSTSEYIVLKHGVYRFSDHWNNVGNCFWLLNGTESTQVCYKKLCIAYCAFKDMEFTFMVFDKILSGVCEALQLQEIIHKTTLQREKQAVSKQTTELVTDAPEMIPEEFFTQAFNTVNENEKHSSENRSHYFGQPVHNHYHFSVYPRPGFA